MNIDWFEVLESPRHEKDEVRQVGLSVGTFTHTRRLKWNYNLA